MPLNHSRPLCLSPLILQYFILSLFSQLLPLLLRQLHFSHSVVHYIHGSTLHWVDQCFSGCRQCGFDWFATWLCRDSFLVGPQWEWLWSGHWLSNFGFDCIVACWLSLGQSCFIWFALLLAFLRSFGSITCWYHVQATVSVITFHIFIKFVPDVIGSLKFVYLTLIFRSYFLELSIHISSSLTFLIYFTSQHLNQFLFLL